MALIKRDSTEYTNEPAVTGGNPILTNSEVLFNDMLGNSTGAYGEERFKPINRTSFGEAVGKIDNDINFFTGKPNVEGLGYNFLYRNYKPELGKWQTSDPLGYPDGWNSLAYVNNRITGCIDWMGGESFEIIWNNTYSGGLDVGIADNGEQLILTGSLSVGANGSVGDTMSEVSVSGSLNFTLFRVDENGMPIGQYDLSGSPSVGVTVENPDSPTVSPVGQLTYGNPTKNTPPILALFYTVSVTPNISTNTVTLMFTWMVVTTLCTEPPPGGFDHLPSISGMLYYNIKITE